MLLEKYARDTVNSSSSVSCKRENSCYEMPEECLVSDDEGNDNDDIDDSDVHQPDHESLRLQREKPTYPPALYRSLRKTVQEPESFSPPSPVPQTPTEKMFQRDKSVIYETTSRKRYHTSPHDKNRVSVVHSLPSPFSVISVWFPVSLICPFSDKN